VVFRLKPKELDNNHQDITVIAFNASCNHIDAMLMGTDKVISSLYNISLISKTISIIGSSNDAVEKFFNNDYEPFDINKISEYRDCERLIIVNENEVIIDANGNN
jgi:hypothetical protein